MCEESLKNHNLLKFKLKVSFTKSFDLKTFQIVSKNMFSFNQSVSYPSIFDKHYFFNFAHQPTNSQTVFIT